MTQRENLIERFQSVRNLTLSLCRPLEIEDYCIQPTPEVSPIKWHLAHTTWFFEELILKKYLPHFEGFDKFYPLLFNSYYKSAGEHWVQSGRGHLSRPTVNEIMRYREFVDEYLINFLSRGDFNDEGERTIEVGLHHEQQHQELMLMDVKFILAQNPSLPSYDSNFPKTLFELPLEWFNFEEGLYDFGKEGDEFSYDNEGPKHKVFLNSFSIRQKQVTNAEYLEFINDKGYEQNNLWLSLGYDWGKQNQVQAPLYWNLLDGEWFEYTLRGNHPLDLNAPVRHLSFFEASAFSQWSGMRLPTEFEMEHYLKKNNLDCGPYWSWTQSQYAPYPGYKKFKGILEEYNGKFMCNQFVLKGGCFATPAGHYRHTYRNFYYPHQRWMFSGLHLAKDL